MPIPALLQKRRLWFKIHSVLGLSLGALWALVGLTGMISVYGDGVDAALNPALHGLPKGSPLPLEQHYRTLMQRYPGHAGAWTLVLPEIPGDALIAVAEKPKLSKDASYRPLTIGLDPSSSAILTEREKGWTFRTFVVKLHANLLAGGFGNTLVGSSGIALLFSITVALGMWIRQKRSMAVRFRIEWRKGMLLFLSDFHRLTGIMMAPVLIIIALTGIAMVFPAIPEFFLGTQGSAHGVKGKTLESTGSGDPGARIRLDEALLIARGPFPHATVWGITTPEGAGGSFKIHLRQRDEARARHPQTAVWIDAYSGQILDVVNPSRFGFGQRLDVLIWPLHTGEWVGGNARILWFLAGLSLPVFFLTGLIRWGIRTHRIADAPATRETLPSALRQLYSSLLAGRDGRLR